MTYGQNRLTQRHGMKERAGLLLAPWLLLAWGSPAMAWSEKDCGRTEYSGQNDCASESQLIQQQTLIDGKQPNEAQRMVWVSEILARQGNPIPSQKPTERMYQYCETLLQDFVRGRNFKPIEPVAILDSPWTHVDERTPELRVPEEWNRCILPNYTKRPVSPFQPIYLSNSIPPYRLYKLRLEQSPGEQWRYVIEMKERGHERYFHAVSLDRCEIHGGLYVNRARVARPGESKPPPQAHVLAQYQGSLMAVSIVDKSSLVIAEATLGARQSKTCHWSY